jgi:tetratricopeptide (TPR) repeat protein
MNIQKIRRPLVLASFIVGSALTMTGWIWSDAQTDQTRYYNAGMIAYNQGDYNLAIKDFDLSYADYIARVNSPISSWQAPGSLEQAELSQEHKALAMVKMEAFKGAVRAYKEALSLTTAKYLADHPLLPGEKDEAKIKAAYAKVLEDRNDAATSLEILYRNQPDLAQEEGDKQQGDPGDKPSEPTNGAAGLNRNKVNQ